MKREHIVVKLIWRSCLAVVLWTPVGTWAQSEPVAQADATAAASTPAPPPTSAQIPFIFLTTRLPYGSTQTITAQVYDAATGGNLIFSEVHPGVSVGPFGEINFVLGSLTTGGIPTKDFPSGASRYLEVVDVTNRSIFTNGRQPLYATSFAITPGPPGPQGPAGPQGPQGSSGASGLNGATGPTGSQGPQGPVGPQGPQGLSGPPGLNGAAGPAGPQGPIGINNRGVWMGTSDYNANDAVSDGGSFWLALVATGANTSNSCEPSQPACTADWQLLAAQGAAGAQGTAGAPGAPGLAGPPGAVGPQGPIGVGTPGPTGAPGPPGAQGPAGPAGPSGTANLAAFRMFVSAFFPGNLATPFTAAQFSPDKDITITRATANLRTGNPLGCNSGLNLRVSDGTHFVDLPFSTFSNTTSLDTQLFSFAYKAGSTVSLALATPCQGAPAASAPADANVIVEYKMQEPTDTNTCYAGTVGATTMCNGSCLDVNDLQSDPNNCGSCGSPCSSNGCLFGGGCQFGSCMPCNQCVPGFLQCNGSSSSCVDPSSDANNCGGCGQACGTTPNGTFICSNATCLPQCNPGYADCDGLFQCETNLKTSIANCGSCGFSCASSQVCSNGQCLVPSNGACTQNSQCVSGLCVGLLGQNLHCL